MRAVVVAVIAALCLSLCLSPGPVPATATAAPAAVARAEPQCTGDNFWSTDRDAERAADLMAGRMTIAPFGAWTMPADPDWTENPFNDSNWVFQYHSLHWLDPLRRVGLARDDEEMLARYRAIVRDWVEDNPVAAPPSRYSWYDMADGFRAIGLTCLAATLETEAAPEPSWLTDAITTHAQMLSDPARYASRGNHGLYQNLGLLALGCARDVPEWRDLAVQRAQTMLDYAVDAEGVTNEGSVLYQTLNRRWWVQLESRLDSCGLPHFPLLDRIDAMPELMAHATQPDGDMVAFGDTSAEQRSQDVAGTVAEYAATGGRAGPRPDRTFAVFQRGYAFSRSGWFDTETADEQSLASIRFGAPKSTAIHGHEDSGAVGFFALGEQLLWQPGLWGGAGGPARRYVVSNQAHNTVDLVGSRYDRTAPTTLLATQETAATDLVSVQSAALKGAWWQRTMVHVKGPHLLVVDDQVTQRGRRGVLQRWHLGSDRTVATGCGRASTSGPGTNATLLWADDCPRLRVAVGQTSPMLGWRSPRVNELVPSPTVTASRSGRQVRMTTIVVPRPEGLAAGDVELLRTSTTDTERVLDVRVGRRVHRITLSVTGATVRTVRSPARVAVRQVRQGGRPAWTVTVRAATEVTPSGRVSVRVGGQAITRRLRAGTATVRLPRLDDGRYRVRTAYLGSDAVAPARAQTRRYVVR